jgi:hypothetical protein
VEAKGRHLAILVLGHIAAIHLPYVSGSSIVVPLTDKNSDPRPPRTQVKWTALLVEGFYRGFHHAAVPRILVPYETKSGSLRLGIHSRPSAFVKGYIARPVAATKRPGVAAGA